jgi:hypothetical protein
MTIGGDRRLGFGLLALLPLIACCGVPLLLVAGVGVAALVWAAGVVAGAAAAGIVLMLVVGRARATRFSRARQRDGSAHEEDPSGPEVDVLYFDGCPNHVPALALLERVAGELGLEPALRLVKVADHEAAQRLRFLGSPTIRVGGRDVDPHTEERTDFGLSCRVFRTEAGIAGQPDERWLRDALARDGQAR